MQEFFDLQHLRWFDACVLLDAVETGAPDLQICHARRIFVGHPESQVARCLAEQCIIGATEFRVYVPNRSKPLEIVGGVCDVLIVGETLDPCQQNFAAWGGKLTFDFGSKRLEPRPDFSLRRFRSANRRGNRLFRCAKSGCESCQAAFNAYATFSNRVLELLAAEWQCGGCGERAEKRSTDYTSGVLRYPGEVAMDEGFCGFAARFDYFRGMDAAVGNRSLFGHGIDAIRRGNQCGLVGRDEATLDCATCFHQFRCEHDIN